MSSSTRLCVLGPLTVQSNEASWTPRSVLKRRILARLALTPDRAVSSELLVDALWSDRSPRTALEALYVHVSQLRSSLRERGLDGLVRSVDGGYRLALDDVEIDAVTFDLFVERGLAAKARGDAREAHANLTDAIESWGDPFVDLADHPAAIGERHRLIARHESAFDELNELAVDIGGDDEVEARLRAAVAQGVLRERPYAQLMQLYDRSERPVLARATLDRARHVFDDALGIDPSPRLQALLDRAASRSAREPSPVDRQMWAALERHVGGAVAFDVSSGHDLGGLAHLAATARRSVPVVLAPPTATVPLSPILDLLPDQTRRTLPSGADRIEWHRTLSTLLEDELGRGAVAVIDHAERLDDMTVDLLAAMLAGDRSPIGFALVCRAPTGRARARVVDLVAEWIDLRDAASSSGQPAATAHLLSPLARQLLELAHCCTTPAPVEILVRALGAPAVRTRRALDELIAARLVSADAAGRIADVTVADAGPPVEALRHHHLALADALTRAVDDDDPYRICAEAWHRLRSLPDGDEAEAWAVAGRAIAYYDRIGAHDDIVQLVDGVAGRPDPALAMLIGRAQMRTGAPTGRVTLEGVVDHARESQDWTVFADAVRALCEERAPQTSNHELRRLVEEALERLGGEATDTRVQLQTDLANSWYFDDAATAERIARDALSVAEGGRADATTARALTGLIQAIWRPDNSEDRLELSIRAQELARRGRSVETQILALTYEAAALIELGRLGPAGPPLRYAEALGADVQIPRFRWWAAAWSAVLGFAEGDLDDTPFADAFRLWRHPNRTDAFECYAAQIAAHRMLTGRAREIADATIVAAREPGAPTLTRAIAAAAAALGDRPSAADELLERFVVDGLPARRDATHGVVLALVAEAAAARACTPLANSLVAELEPLADRHAVVNVWGGGGLYWGSLRHALGLSAALAGEVERGRTELLRAARELADAGSARFAERSRAASTVLGDRI